MTRTYGGARIPLREHKQSALPGDRIRVRNEEHRGSNLQLLAFVSGSCSSTEEIALSSSRIRSALKIRLDILETVRDEGPSKPTKIMRMAKLSHDRLVRYLGELVSRGLLKENRDSSARSYTLTAKGLDFVNQMKETEAFFVTVFGLSI
jgi:predicted transcriptional regulator